MNYMCKNTEFIDKAEKIHGNKYSYCECAYEGYNIPVMICCNLCGEKFQQQPRVHLKGSGCKKCADNKKRMSTEEFIERARKIHGNKYDYSKTVYDQQRGKIKIICPEHGEFEQIAGNHIHPTNPVVGCTKCLNRRFKTLEKFIEESREIYGDSFDYSNTYYERVDKKLEIVCNSCGKSFMRTPNRHLANHGCPHCRRLTYEDFIERARKIHGDTYIHKENYPDIKHHSKIEIECRKHGIFTQDVAAHLAGKGCSKCRESKGERAIAKFLNENNILFEAQKKFPTCKYKKELPFDFYLPDYNVVIEFNGEQHYKPIKYYGGHKKLKIRQERDQIKKDWCSNNNINLIILNEIKDITTIIEKINERKSAS